MEHLLAYEPFLPEGWLAKYGLKHDPARDHGLVFGDPSAGSRQRGILGGKGRRCCLALKYGRRVFYPIESAYVWDTFYELIIAYQARAKRIVDSSRWNSWTFAHLLPFLRYAAASDAMKLKHLRAAKHAKHLAALALSWSVEYITEAAWLKQRDREVDQVADSAVPIPVSR